ncbi:MULTISPECIES: carbohydrate ABC transporter permease [Kitasatospora]|uniref:Arabinogalactan oligomer/maltooligosaccharide transport system permease protein n=2 Tax=Kitasatospora TaxID=2063 RepID=A0ABT1J5B3_9ACTN|nr:sugar ABC transporter permease [Kitasatospora paracochleata]MCP2312314.1 arabinogalactan oligomer/maltooligosaccharide transport system permease protein [Kitasatospora paracochleata]
MAVDTTTSQPTATAAGGDTPARGPRRTAGTPGRLRLALGKHWYAWTLVAPVVIVIAVLVGYPLVQGLYLSTTDANDKNSEKQIGDFLHIPASYKNVGLSNYTDILFGAHTNFWARLGWTVTWTVSCVAVSFVIGLTLAIMLNRKVRGRSVYRTLLILPWAVPAFVSTFSWRFIMNNDRGFLNHALQALGLPTFDWLNDPTMAQISVVMVNVWLAFPFVMVAVLGGLQSIPGELYEAAEMDGANAWQQFWNITLPALRPISSTVILLSTIWTFNMFPVIFLLTNGGPGDETQLLVTAAYQKAFTGLRQFGESSAWGVLILLILVVFAVVYRRSLRKQGEVW